MERLRTECGGYTIHNAGLPIFARNFSRDSLISGLIAGDGDLLRNQLCYSAFRQAVAKDPYSGAEPGKIHHETTIEIRGLSTEFNRKDTLFYYTIQTLWLSS